METSETGCARSVLHPFGKCFRVRLDLVLQNDVAIRRLAEAYGEGASKYGIATWKRGFEESVYLNHAMEHLLKHVAGDVTEDHLAHAVWNLNTLMWIQENKPELLDLTGKKHEPKDSNPHKRFWGPLSYHWTRLVKKLKGAGG